MKKKVLFTKKQILNRCKKIGEKISFFYKEKNKTNKLLLICVLKGSIIFFSYLIQYININFEIDFLKSVSYYKTKKICKPFISGIENLISVKNKNILLVDDIIDSGETYEKLKKLLYKKGAKNVKIASLIKKKKYKINKEKIFFGFEISDFFIIGFGLDYKEKYRNLPYIFYLEK